MVEPREAGSASIEVGGRLRRGVDSGKIARDLGGGERAIWISGEQEMERVLEAVSAVRWAAVDTEFHRERTYYPKLALLQIKAGEEIFLIDALTTPLEPLAPAFSDPGREFIFHAAEQDLEILERSVGIRPERVFDTQIAAGFVGLAKASLGALLAHFLGIQITKSARLSDWMARPLSPEQLSYAASDVDHLWELRSRIASELAELCRYEWALEEMAVATHRRRSAMAPDHAWLRIRECRGLDREAKRVAAKVAAWREQRAREIDVPVKTVLSDLAVAAIAKALPESREALLAIRGVEPRRMRREVVDELVAVVAESRSHGSEAADDLPASMTASPEQLPLVLLCASMVHSRALGVGIDPTLIASREEIALYVASRSGPLAGGWRYELVGESLDRVVSGEATLRVEGVSVVEEITALPKPLRSFGAGRSGR